MKTQKMYGILTLFTLLGLLVGACGASSAEATATPEGLAAVHTAAAETVSAQFSQTAQAKPSASLTPSPTITLTATPASPQPSPTSGASALPSGGGSLGGVSGAVGCNNSAYVADVTVPDGQAFSSGATFTKTWRIKNAGSCAWTTGYKIVFLSGDQMSGTAATLPAAVEVGATVDVSVTLTAPSAAKTYVGYWQIATDAGQNFGERFYVQIAVNGTPGTPGTGTVTATPAYGAVGCQNSSFVSETSTGSVTAGKTFTKSWTIKNTGTCEWKEDFKFVYIGGDLMGADTTKLRSGTIKPGSSLTFTLTFTAPSEPGSYTGYWRLATNAGELFGSQFTVGVTIAGSTYTPVPTSSSTATSTPEPTQTPSLTPATYP